MKNKIIPIISSIGIVTGFTILCYHLFNLPEIGVLLGASVAVLVIDRKQ